MSATDSPTSDILYPLSAFAGEAGRGINRAQILEGEELPEPYRALLVHDRDMTGTLETYHDQLVSLHVIMKRIDGDHMLRQVTLVGTADGQPKEFGAIRIDLSCFEEDARRVVASCAMPLGRVLREYGVAYVSNPSAFLRISPDERLCEALNVKAGPLYGRKNELTTPDGRSIAHIIEILPPMATPEQQA